MAIKMKDFYELDPEGDVELVLPVPLENTGDILPAEDATTRLQEAAYSVEEDTPCDGAACCNEITPFDEGAPCDDVGPCDEVTPCEDETPCIDTDPEFKTIYEDMSVAAGDTAHIETRVEIPDEDSELAAEAELTRPELESMSARESTPVGKSDDGYSIISAEAAPEPPVDDTLRNFTVRFLVSSHHLRLSSPAFHTLLQQRMPDGIAPRRISIPLNDDRPQALLTLLQILHHRTWDVPQELNLDSLAKFATLVDKYDCLEAVEPLSSVWIDKLKVRLPNTFSKELRAWLHIAWVFEKTEEFRHLTKIVELNIDSNGNGEYAMEFPIANAILHAIQPKRIEALTGLIKIFQDLSEKYQDSNTIHCLDRNPECDTMVLGSLIRHGRSIKLLPLPQLPYQGLSVLGVAEVIKELKWPTSCRRNRRYYSDGRTCGVEEAVKREVESWRERLQGLELGRLRRHRGRRGEGRQ